MKLFLELELPFVEVETDSGHGEIEAVWLDGDDWANKSVAEFVRACFGSEFSFAQRLSNAHDLAIEANQEERAIDTAIPS